MEVLNKHIKKKGIILLIKKYSEIDTEEIYKIVFDLKNKLYYNKNKLFPIARKCSLKPKQVKYNEPLITVYVLTNDSFKKINYYKRNCSYVNIKFNKNDINIYLQMFKDSIKLFSNNFVSKYRHLNDNPLKSTKIILIDKMNKILKKCGNYYYNIKLSTESHKFNKTISNIYTDQNDVIYNIRDIIPKKPKQNIIINSSNLINDICPI
jgi:hypothetical protein